MYEYPSISLIEVFDCTSLRIELYSTGDGLGELLVWKIDPSQLGIESAGDERPYERCIIGIFVEGRGGAKAIGYESDFAEGGHVLALVGCDVIKSLV
jgi:hypothetical protein